MKASTLATAFALAAMLGMAASPAQAFTRNTTVTGADGKTASRNVTRSGGNVARTTVYPDGRTGSRVVTRNDGHVDAQVTGANGRSWSRVAQRQPGQASTTVNGPNGTFTRHTYY